MCVLGWWMQAPLSHPKSQNEPRGQTGRVTCSPRASSEDTGLCLSLGSCRPQRDPQPPQPGGTRCPGGSHAAPCRETHLPKPPGPARVGSGGSEAAPWTVCWAFLQEDHAPDRKSLGPRAPGGSAGLQLSPVPCGFPGEGTASQRWPAQCPPAHTGPCQAEAQGAGVHLPRVPAAGCPAAWLELVPG